MKRRYLLFILILLAGCSLFIGVKEVTLSQLFQQNEEQLHILFVSRLPRLISIVIAGMSLSISGVIMQQLTRNKFVEPTTAGTMDAAKLGILVSLMIFTNASPIQKMLIAFLFALVGTMLFIKILDKVRYKDSIFVPLVGLMFGGILSSITTFFAYKHDLIQNINSWLQGDFSMIVAGQYELIYLSIPLVCIAYFYANAFTVAGMGETFAMNLGLNYKRIVNIGLIIVSLISAVVILTVGSIPFLGLIIPNIVSIFRGDYLKKSLGHTALLGAIFVLCCDILGRIIIYPFEISIGLMVGIIGSIIFLYLLVGRKTA